MGQAVQDELTLEERTLLEDPLAAEALKRLGMTVDMLKHKSLAYFGSTGDAAVAFEHNEKRRHLLWTRVRDEHALLQRTPSVTTSQVGGLSTPGGDTRLERMRRGQQASMRSMLERQSRAVQREAEVEQRAERAALRQEMASANRDNQQLLRERELQHLKIKHGVRAQIHQERRETSEQVRAEEAAVRDARGSSLGGGGGGGGGRRGGAGGGAGGGADPRTVDAARARERRVEQEEARQQALREQLESKVERAALRKQEIEYERERKKVQNETKLLQHELRKAAAEGVAHEATIASQHEALSKQQRAATKLAVREDERQEGETGRAAALQARKERSEAARRAFDEQRKQEEEERRQHHEEKEAVSVEAAEARRRQQAAERRATATLRAMKARARIQIVKVGEESRRIELEREAEQKQRAADDLREARKAQRDSGRRGGGAMQREADRKENIERLRRAAEYKEARTQASIARKERLADERRQLQGAAEAERRHRQALEARTRRELHESLEAQLRAIADGGGAAVLDLGLAMPSKAGPPSTIAASSSAGRVGAAMRARPSSAPPPRRAADEDEAAARAKERERAALARERAARGRARDRAGHAAAAERQDEQGRLAAIERIRREQNRVLLRALEAEQEREARRADLVAETSAGPDRERLLKIFELERSQASADMMALTADHELALAQRMAELGMTR